MTDIQRTSMMISNLQHKIEKIEEVIREKDKTIEMLENKLKSRRKQPTT